MREGIDQQPAGGGTSPKDGEDGHLTERKPVGRELSLLPGACYTLNHWYSIRKWTDVRSDGRATSGSAWLIVGQICTLST